MRRLPAGHEDCLVRKENEPMTIESDLLGIVEDKLYSIPEAAKLLGLTRQTIYNRLDTGDLRAVRVGTRSQRIPGPVLRAYLTAQQGGE